MPSWEKNTKNIYILHKSRKYDIVVNVIGFSDVFLKKELEKQKNTEIKSKFFIIFCFSHRQAE